MLRSAIPLLTLVLICSPIGAGAMNNLWSAVAPDWHAGPELVALVTGVFNGGSSFGSGGGERVNYSDLSFRWLFQNFDRAILKEHDLRAELEGNNKALIGTIFEVATADTNGDGRITEDDRVAAFFSGASGSKPIEIISPCDQILSVDQVTNDQVLIVSQRGAAVSAALFSTRDGAKIKESPLPLNQ